MGVNENIKDAKSAKYPSMILKLDYEKAFDSIDWKYLEHMLNGFGFARKWTRWILECVTTAHTDTLVNGSTTGDFKLERG